MWQEALKNAYDTSRNDGVLMISMIQRLHIDSFVVLLLHELVPSTIFCQMHLKSRPRACCQLHQREIGELCRINTSDPRHWQHQCKRRSAARRRQQLLPSFKQPRWVGTTATGKTWNISKSQLSRHSTHIFIPRGGLAFEFMFVLLHIMYVCYVRMYVLILQRVFLRLCLLPIQHVYTASCLFSPKIHH